MISLPQRCNHLMIVTFLYNSFIQTLVPLQLFDLIYASSWRWDHSALILLSNVTCLCIIKAEKLKCVKLAKWQGVCGVIVYCLGCVSSYQVPKLGCWGGESCGSGCGAEPPSRERIVWLSALNECAWLKCISNLFLYQNRCNFRAAWQRCLSVWSCQEHWLIQTSF